MLDGLAKRRRARRLADDLYRRIVAQSRLPEFYADLGVPDTPDGRLEVLILHLYLALERLRTQNGQGDAIAQRLIDLFFADLDTSLRELGVGDLAVPKRMRALAGRVYARLDAYRGAGGRTADLAPIIRDHICQGAARCEADTIASYLARSLMLAGSRPESPAEAATLAFAPISERPNDSDRP